MAGQDRFYRHSRKDSETILQDDNIRESRAVVRTSGSDNRKYATENRRTRLLRGQGLQKFSLCINF
ncbi:MAG TPA: hypothetical protein VJ799_11070 [Nitrososphaeraceae archaeon]|nr:hypothetical protein [Nitrososphaeraceae archaeon]